MIMIKFTWAKILIVTLALAACEKTKNFPKEPVVKLTSVAVVGPGVDPLVPNEHVIITFDFTDGDGDLGLDDDMRNPPFCIGCEYEFNLWANVSSKVNGEFIFDYKYPSRIKNLTPNSNNPTIEGQMIYKIDVANRRSDTVIIDFLLIDRALNKSNKEVTDPIYINW